MSLNYSTWYSNIHAQRSEAQRAFLNPKWIAPLAVLPLLLTGLGLFIINKSNSPIHPLLITTLVALEIIKLLRLTTGITILTTEIAKTWKAWINPNRTNVLSPIATTAHSAEHRNFSNNDILQSTSVDIHQDISYYKATSVGYILTLASAACIFINFELALSHYKLPILGMLAGLTIMVGTKAFQYITETRATSFTSIPPTEISTIASSSSSKEIRAGFN